MVLHNFFLLCFRSNMDFKMLTDFMIHPVYFVNKIFLYKKKYVLRHNQSTELLMGFLKCGQTFL